jgi:hypothetical protein
MTRAQPRRGTLGLVGLALVFAACGSEGPIEPQPEPPPTFFFAVARANPHNTISAVVTVAASGADSAFVRFWQDGGASHRSPAYTFAGDTLVLVSMLGLDTSATYAVEINLVWADTLSEAFDTTNFTSGSLPAWVPQAGVQGSDTTPGFLALSYPEGPVIIDNSGKVVWYRHFPNGVLNSFQSFADGRYTVLGLDDTTNQFHVLDELGEEVGGLSCVGRPTRFHDLLVVSGSDAWMLCDETRTMDLSGLGGVDTAQVTATVVQHVSAAGLVLWEWNSFDHFDITDLPATSRGGPNVNFTHGNSVALDTDGNLILSFRSLNEITKVNTTTGAVMWRFGGLANQFALLGDPKGSFERQHGVRPSGTSQIQFLDNGDVAPSRVVRFQMDPVAGTAQLVWEFRDSDMTHTFVGGSTQVHANGYGLVSFGREGRVIEVNSSGTRAWELTGIDGVYVFRAQRIPSLYASERIEPTQ